MDELDKKLYHDLSLEPEIPIQCENIIKEALNKKVHYHSLTRIIITACATFLVTAGIVYAGATISNKIWKEPEKVVGFDSNENTITSEQLEGVMSEEEAKQKVNDLLDSFNSTYKNIKSIKLENNSDNYELMWHITIDNGTYNENIIEFDAKGQNSLSIVFNDVLDNENIQKYSTSKQEAEKAARDLCIKYGYDMQKYDYVKVTSNLLSEDESYIWYVQFSKTYNGIPNPYETLRIGFIPEINKLYCLKFIDLNYEDNPVKILKDQAVQIVLEVEQKINTGYEIKNTYANLDIARMNGDAYLRMNDYQQYYEQISTANYPFENRTSYRTDSPIRQVWMVTVEYNILNSDTSHIPFNKYYTYYIDATTGEIIGGNLSYYIFSTRLSNK